MKKRMAIYKTEYGNLFAYETKHFEEDPGYTRVSEIVEIDFEMLSDDAQISAQVASIDGMIEKITTESLRKIDELKTKRAELLALTHEAAS